MNQSSSMQEYDMDKISDTEETVPLRQSKSKPKKSKAETKKTSEKKSYRCDRCNFSSSSKAKYTKHAKSAHSGTIVQCDHCEFKTPYKWNLDRHYKNHLGGGALCCHLCNFSCDIKQSLTVHLQNHHTNVPEEIIESVKRQQIPSKQHKTLENSSPSANPVVVVATPSSAISNSGSDNAEEDVSEEKKVPPLRISRSLTGLSLDDSNPPKKVDEVEPPDSNKHANSTTPTHKGSKHKELPNASPSSLHVPNPCLPPKKGINSPKVGAPAESMSPSVQRSQSPMKASEAAYTDMGHHGSSASDIMEMKPHSPSPSQSMPDNDVACTAPVQNDNVSPIPSVVSLKKPKQRALASFYEKLNLKLTEGGGHAPESASVSNQATTSTKSNRCQYCRQRCKSSVDLATHLEKCVDARSTKKDDDEQAPGAAMSPFQVPVQTKVGPPFVEAMEESEFESRTQNLNGSNNDNDGLIGFETAPGVGAIHTGQMEEMEYQGYQGRSENDNPKIHLSPISSPDEEEKDDIDEDDIHDDDEEEGEKSGRKNGKMITTRKVYRCPESDCPFWATTASRFHVHIVGHSNFKPFECSECHYKSNWRWDVNKHIRLKTPKDPKHAKAKTLLTHESGQRDYRKYDNYLVTMALTHSANAKAPDCSTVASKRTKNSVATPKASPELSSPSQKDLEASPLDSPGGGKQKLPKLTKAPATSSTASPIPATTVAATEGSGTHANSQITHASDTASSTDLASSSTSPGGNKGEGRSFVETRMHAGGEIYQTSTNIPKHDDDHSTTVATIKEDQEEMETDRLPSGVDLTLKRSRPREDDTKASNNDLMIPVQNKKSRLHHHHQQHHAKEQGLEKSGSGATVGNSIVSIWQCIKCNFKHSNKDVVNSHIRELHRPKKGDPAVSLLTHNHLVQLLIPEQDAAGLMSNNDSTTVEQKKGDTCQQMYTENGKVMSCKHCPYTTGLLYEMEIHAEHHLHRSASYYSCPHCSYSVPVKSELQEHLRLHGGNNADKISLPQLEIQNRLVNSSTMISSTTAESNQGLPMSMKRKKYNCIECPFGTSNLSKFQYHTQGHEPREQPFKCHRCSFNVSVKLHLLQHLRVHGIQIDEIGFPSADYNDTDDSGDEFNAQQNEDSDEPLNLSIFANRKPIVVWDTNGMPVEMYRCEVCPELFRDLGDLREHEFVSNHRMTTKTSMSSSSSLGRQCDSPPCEAVNLSLKPSQKKSSQSSSGGNAKDSQANRSVTTSSSTSSSIIPLLSPTLSADSSSGVAQSKAERESLYLCDECPARFFFEKELKIHHTFHENKSTFQCSECSYSARQKDPHLMSHMRVHGATYQEKTKSLLHRFPRAKVTFASTTPAPTAAAILSASLLSSSSMINPNYLHTNAVIPPSSSTSSKAAAKGAEPISIVCPKCPEKLYSPGAYQQHIAFHGTPTEFRCRFCDFYAHTRKALTVHELVHTGSEIIIEAAAAAAASAGSKSQTFNPVSMMAMVSHQDSPFTGFHASAVEPDIGERSNGPVPDEAYEGNPSFVYPTYLKNGRVKSKRYKCVKCPSAFEKKDQYHTHIGLHGSNQKYKCTICDYAVTYYANYIQHLKKHENQRNASGELVHGKRRNSLILENDGGALEGHPLVAKMSETGEHSPISSGSLSDSCEQQQIPIKCAFCPFHCFDESTLELHMNHHQGNPNWIHACTDCTFRAPSKKMLKEHSRLHMLNKFHEVKGNGYKQKKKPVKSGGAHLNGKNRGLSYHPSGNNEHEDSSNESF